MNTKLTQKIEELIVKLGLNCSVSEFADKVDWDDISRYQKLDNDIIREFADKVNWWYISRYQKLDSATIRKFDYRVNWYYISRCQKLDNDIIREFSDRVNWCYISRYQKLDNDIIREFSDRVDWECISRYQKLDNDAIREFADKVDWDDISRCQKLDNDLMMEFADRLDIEVQLKKHHAEKSNSAVYGYARKHNLKIENGYLYAFRNHDKLGRGAFNKTIFYEKGGVYKDWHCDLDSAEENSFGLGIWPCGNTPVRVKLEYFGVEVRNDGNGKARVWEFEVL